MQECLRHKIAGNVISSQSLRVVLYTKNQIDHHLLIAGPDFRGTLVLK